MSYLEKFVFNTFQVNTYLVWDDSRECIIIDPAFQDDTERQRLTAFLASESLSPVRILNTHCHVDHLLGIPEIKQEYNIPFLCHREETSLLEKAHIMGRALGFNAAPFPAPDRYLEDGEVIDFGNSRLKALLVPGHSAGSLAFLDEEAGFVITGDALFAGGIGRTDLPGGNYDQLIHSISAQLFELPGDTVIWPGHGPSSTIGEEVKNNPFF